MTRRDLIWELSARGTPVPHIALEFGVTSQRIYQILQGSEEGLARKRQRLAGGYRARLQEPGGPERFYYTERFAPLERGR